MTIKDQLRREMKELLRKRSREEFRSQGERALSLLRPTRLWSGFSSIYIFLSMETEIDTEPFISAALEEGKKVFAPKIDPGEKLEFFSVLSVQGNLGKASETEDFPVLILCPGLAFDREGKRLGRGKAYYDRYIAELENGGRQFFTLGLCMDFQLVNNVPFDNNDRKMNGILTGDNILFLNSEQ